MHIMVRIPQGIPRQTAFELLLPDDDENMLSWILRTACVVAGKPVENVKKMSKNKTMYR